MQNWSFKLGNNLHVHREALTANKSAIALSPVVRDIYVAAFIASTEERNVIMDLFHRETRGKDTPTGPDCEFCYRTDPNFGKREPMDRLVVSQLDNTAAAHLTEDGYIKHRIAELTQRLAAPALEMELLKSA